MTDSKKKPKHPDDAPPKSAFARTRKLLHLAAQVSQKEASHRISHLFQETNPLKRLQNQLDQATLLVESLNQLKGAAMKAGQLLSIEAGDFLPPQVIEILGKLQDSGSALSEETVREILLNEWGAEKFAQFRRIDFKPCASASIGQVHRAECAHGEVALKIQFPGVADSIESDIYVLQRALSGFFKITGRDIDLDQLFRELGQVLAQETNYVAEAVHLRTFRELLRNSPQYVVPQDFPEFTTQKILMMSYEPGLKLKEWMDGSPTAAQKEHYGRLMLDLYVKEFFEHGLVQTDPNFANFLFRPDTQQLVILDFGAVRSYSPEFRRDYKELLRIMRYGGNDEIIAHAVGMDLIKAAESPECLAAFIDMLKISVAPFDHDKQPFDFASVDYAKQVRDVTMGFTSKVRHSAPPHQLVFLHRKLGGVFSLLRRLDTTINLDEYWQRIVES